MFYALARLSSLKPKLVLGFWITLFIIIQPLVLRVGEVLSSDIGLLPGSVEAQVNRILNEEFLRAGSYQIVLIAPFAEDSHRHFDLLVTQLRTLPVVDQIVDDSASISLPLTTERNDQLALITIKADSWLAALKAVERIQAVIDASPGQFWLTGGVAVDSEISSLAKADTRKAEIIGLPISFVILVLAFGALVAASLPLIVALVSISLALALLYLTGQLMTFATYAQVIVTMLGLATGIDYALLFVNRFREELQRDSNPEKAAFHTSMTAGRAVFFSGVTVLLALSCLLLSPSLFIRSIGLGGMFILFSSVLVSLTLLPAVLVLLGHRVNTLSIPRRFILWQHPAFWLAWSKRVLKRPWLWTSLSLGLLLLMIWPLTQMRLAVAEYEGFGPDTHIGQSYQLLKDGEVDALLRSHLVLVDFGEQGFYHPSSVLDMSKLSRTVLALDGVAFGLSASIIEGVPRLLLRQYYATQALALSSPLADLVKATVSKDGRYALLQVFPRGDLARGEELALVDALYALGQDLELELIVGGDIVGEQAWIKGIYQPFPLAVLLVYLTTFVLLSLAFKSLLIPLKSILLNTLTVAAALGVVTMVSQFGWGIQLFGLAQVPGFVDSVAPIFLFATVFGISMDYEVFLVARIYEGHQQGLSDEQAVAQALMKTGSVISSAALVMIVVFSVFTMSHIVTVKTLGLGLAVAVFLDMSLVRLVLVPTMMVMLGRWNWWWPAVLEPLTQSVEFKHD